MLKINGVELPAPDSIQPGIMDISKGRRNSAGTMLIRRIATKRKLELSWTILKANQLSKILKLVSEVFFNVEYIDPEDNKVKSGTFYAGDRTMQIALMKNGVVELYKNVKFNVIER